MEWIRTELSVAAATWRMRNVRRVHGVRCTVHATATKKMKKKNRKTTNP